MASQRAKDATKEIFTRSQPIYSDVDEIAELLDRHYPEQDSRDMARNQLNNAIIAKITEYNSTDSALDLMSRLHAVRSLVENFKAGAQAQAYISQAIEKLAAPRT